jgi:uncharacterized protein (DUF1697 family)
MPRYIAFLRGVSPMNLKMVDFKRCLENAGYMNVKTVLSSGNAAFDSSSKSVSAIERQIEAIFTKQLGRSFYTIVRSVEELHRLIERDPCSGFALPSDAKRVVTFARRLPAVKSKLPIERDGAQILAVTDREAFSAYVPIPKGVVFMELIKANLGSDVTTRTWETIKKCAKA